MYLGEQIADTADTANDARVARIELDQLAQAHDEVVDRARGWKFIGRPGAIQDLIAADGFANALGQQTQHGAFLVGQRNTVAIDRSRKTLEVHQRATDAHLSAYFTGHARQILS